MLVIDNYMVWRIADPREFMRAFPGERRRRRAAHRSRRARRGARGGRPPHARGGAEGPARRDHGGDHRATRARRSNRYGIEVDDVRINRTELPPGTEESVYARMKTERERLAKKNRAEGEERARRIRAEADREARVIVANARRDAEIARGEGDAEAARIYARGLLGRSRLLRVRAQPRGLSQDDRRPHHARAVARHRVLPVPRRAGARMRRRGALQLLVRAKLHAPNAPNATSTSHGASAIAAMPPAPITLADVWSA